MKNAILAKTVFVCFLGGFCCVASDEVLEKPQPNTIGHVNDYGEASIWFELPPAYSINVGDLKIPLRFHYSSNQRMIANSVAGIGWEMPAIESCVIERSESAICALMPGGYPLTLIKTGSSDDGVYESFDRRWKAKVNGKDVMLDNDDSAIKVRYHSGKIESIACSNNIFLKYRRTGGLVTSIENEKGDALVKFLYNDRGVLSSIVPKRGQQFQTSISKVPVLNSDGVPVILAESIDGGVGSDSYFRIEREIDGKNLKVKIEHNLIGDGNDESLVVDAGSAKLLKDSLHEYQYRKNENGFGITMTSLENKGRSEFYEFDGKSFSAKCGNINGTTAQHYYVGTEGAAFGKRRLVEFFDNEGKKTDSIRSFFDSNGKMLREGLGEGISVKYLPSTSVFNGKPKRHFSPDGKLTRIELPGGAGEIQIISDEKN